MARTYFVEATYEWQDFTYFFTTYTHEEEEFDDALLHGARQALLEEYGYEAVEDFDTTLLEINGVSEEDAPW